MNTLWTQCEDTTLKGLPTHVWHTMWTHCEHTVNTGIGAAGNGGADLPDVWPPEKLEKWDDSPLAGECRCVHNVFTMCAQCVHNVFSEAWEVRWFATRRTPPPFTTNSIQCAHSIRQNEVHTFQHTSLAIQRTLMLTWQRILWNAHGSTRHPSVNPRQTLWTHYTHYY